MGVSDNGTLGRLAEDLGEADGGHRPAADQIREQVSRPHGGKLVRVAYQNQTAVPTQGSHQGGHQGHIHHGDLVHNDRIRLQRVVLVVGEHQLAGVGVKAGLQQAVDGRCLGGAQFPQTLGRPAGGGGQGSLQPHGLEQGQHAPQAGGLSGARSASEQHYLPLGRLAHRLKLLGCVGDPLGPLDLLQQAVQPLRGQEFCPAHLAHPLGDISLCLIQGGEIDRLLSRHLVQVHLAPDGQCIQTLLQQRLLALQ